jgi:hypothetical protein
MMTIFGRAAQKGQVELTLMGCPVFSHQAAAVDGEYDWQSFDTDIMDNLIVGALQESGVDGDDRSKTLGRQSGRKGDAMLFGNSHIEESDAENVPQNGSVPVPSGMAAVTATILSSGFCHFDHEIAENLRICRQGTLGRRAVACFYIETPHPMKIDRIFLGLRYPFPLVVVTCSSTGSLSF